MASRAWPERSEKAASGGPWAPATQCKLWELPPTRPCQISSTASTWPTSTAPARRRCDKSSEVMASPVPMWAPHRWHASFGRDAPPPCAAVVAVAGGRRCADASACTPHPRRLPAPAVGPAVHAGHRLRQPAALGAARVFAATGAPCGCAAGAAGGADAGTRSQRLPPDAHRPDGAADVAGPGAPRAAVAGRAGAPHPGRRHRPQLPAPAARRRRPQRACAPAARRPVHRRPRRPRCARAACGCRCRPTDSPPATSRWCTRATGATTTTRCARAPSSTSWCLGWCHAACAWPAWATRSAPARQGGGDRPRDPLHRLVQRRPLFSHARHRTRADRLQPRAGRAGAGLARRPAARRRLPGPFVPEDLL
jgi:hypothetical protein